MDRQGTKHPSTNAASEPDLADWPVDVQRIDASGEVDLGQLEFNRSLTPRERIEQNDAWVKFLQIARRAGQQLRPERPTSSISRIESDFIAV